MKKIYTLCTVMLLTGVVSAQINLDFEAVIIDTFWGAPELSATDGWELGFFSAETTDPGQGLQSCSMTTFYGPHFQTPFPNDIVPGFISQEVIGTIVNPQNISVDFKYKYTPQEDDQAFFGVELYDTLQTGYQDDIVIYEGSLTLNQMTSWSTGTIILTATGTPGTVNSMYMQVASSIGPLMDDNTLPPGAPGSVLVLDDIVIHNLAFLGVEEQNRVNVSIYPNPALNVLNFRMENAEATAIAIYALDGKSVLSTLTNGITGSIDVSSLNAGMYFYEITTSNGTTLKNTFVKE